MSETLKSNIWEDQDFRKGYSVGKKYFLKNLWNLGKKCISIVK